MLRLPNLGEMDRGMAQGIYLCTAPADMRKGFDSLAALVRDHLGRDPMARDLFLFVGRAKDRLKLLYWDGDGFALWYKRLEEGTFRLPSARATCRLRVWNSRPASWRCFWRASIWPASSGGNALPVRYIRYENNSKYRPNFCPVHASYMA